MKIWPEFIIVTVRSILCARLYSMRPQVTNARFSQNICAVDGVGTSLSDA